MRKVMLWAIWRNASSVVSTPPWATRAANRSIVDDAEWEWVVLIVPAPACMASNMAPASEPRTSPTMIRDKFCRSASGMRSATLNSPTRRPSTVSPMPTVACRATMLRPGWRWVSNS